MKTEIYKVDNDCSNFPESAGEIIRSGGLVAFPTETVYGLGANALDPEAAKKIYAAKGRPSDNPLIIHISKVEDAEKYCYTTPMFYKLAEAFLPGALTVIMKKKDIIPFEVTGGLDTVAVRLPSNPIARRLIDKAGVPIAAPSANLSGRPSPTTAAHVIADLNGRCDMIIDGGQCEIGLESTIVKPEDDCLTLLRPGGITVEMLSAICPVIIDKAVTAKLSEGERPLAPGMKYRHYAPETPVVLVDGSLDLLKEFVRNKASSSKVGVLLSEKEAPQFGGINVRILTFCDEAHDLFARLREVDNQHCDIFYARLPSKEGIGFAVYNRILKAAGYEIISL